MSYLWLVRWQPYPPVHGGDVDYSRDLIEALALVHPVRGLALGDEGGAPPPGSPIGWSHGVTPRRRRAMSLLTALPNVAYRYRDRDFLRRALAAAMDADAVFVDFIALAWLVEPLTRALGRAGRGTPVIVVNHNHERSLRARMAAHAPTALQRLAVSYDSWKAGRLERRANRVADGLTAITAADRDRFTADCATPAIVVEPLYTGPVRSERRITAATPRRVAMIGHRTAQHKIMVMNATLAALAAADVPAAVGIDVVGEGDYRAAATAYPRVNFMGFIDDIAAYADGARLAIVPDIVGGGFKYRALMHAMLRLPMLALRDAMAGMDFVPGEHFLPADDLDQLAAMIPGALDDIDRLNALQEAAFRHAQAYLDRHARGTALHRFAQGLR